MGARGMLRDGGPMTPGPIEGIDGIEGMGGGPIGAELITGGGPRLRVGKFEPMGERIGAEVTEQMGADPRDDGPIGAAGLGNWESLEW